MRNSRFFLKKKSCSPKKREKLNAFNIFRFLLNVFKSFPYCFVNLPIYIYVYISDPAHKKEGERDFFLKRLHGSGAPKREKISTCAKYYVGIASKILH